MGLEAVLGASDIPVSGAEVFISSGGCDVEVLREPCVLVEADASATGPGVHRRGFRGASAILERLALIVPERIKQRWQGTGGEPSDMAACVVGIRGGHLCVRWSDSSGYRGSFHKPLRNSFEVFVNAPQGTEVLKPGEGALVAAAWPRGTAWAPPMAGCWEEERGLDEPDAAWCLRQPMVPWEKIGAEEDGDTVEVEEEVVLLRARPGRLGAGPDVRCLGREATRTGRGAVRSAFSNFRAFSLLRPQAAPEASEDGAGSDDAATDSPPPASPPGGAEQQAVATPGPRDYPDAVAAGGSGAARLGSIGLAGAPPSSCQIAEVAPGRLRLEICFPGARHASDLRLDVAPGSVRVASANGDTAPGDALNISLPFEVDPATARARFSTSRDRLIVSLAGAAPLEGSSSNTLD